MASILLIANAYQLPDTDIPLADRLKVDSVLTLLDQRLSIATMVAQAKWNSGAPISDPAREAKILDDLTSALLPSSDSEVSFIRHFFQAQFDAGKLIQSDLHAQWRKEAKGSFAAPPDLGRDIRPLLDRLTPALIGALRKVRPLLQQASA